MTKNLTTIETPDSRNVYQWKYASCKQNIEGRVGFFTFSLSKELTSEEKEELVEKAAHYREREGAPARPTKDDLRNSFLFPVAFLYFTLKSSERRVLCQTCATGEVYEGGRYGGFFSHALILEKDARFPYCPIDYWGSETLERELSPEEQALETTPEPLPSLDLDDLKRSETFLKRFEKNFRPKYGVYFVERFLVAMRAKKKLIVTGALESETEWPALFIKALYEALPAQVSDLIRFTTYCDDPIQESALFDAESSAFVLIFVPVSSSRPNDWRALEDFACCNINDVAAAESKDSPSKFAFVETLKNSLTDAASKDAFKRFINSFDYATYLSDGSRLATALESVAILFKIFNGDGGASNKKRLADSKRCERVYAFLREQLSALKNSDASEAQKETRFAELLRLAVRCDKARCVDLVKKSVEVDDYENFITVVCNDSTADDKSQTLNDKQTEENQLVSAQEFTKEVVDYWLNEVSANDSDSSADWIANAPRFFADIFQREYCESAFAYMQEIDRRLKEKKSDDKTVIEGESETNDEENDKAPQEENWSLIDANRLVLALGVYTAIYCNDAERENFFGVATFEDGGVNDFNAQSVMEEARNSLPTAVDDAQKLWNAFLPNIRNDATRSEIFDALSPVCYHINDADIFNDLGGEHFPFLESWKRGESWEKFQSEKESKPSEEAAWTFLLKNEGFEQQVIDVCADALQKSVAAFVNRELESLRQELQNQGSAEVDERIKAIRSATLKRISAEVGINPASFPSDQPLGLTLSDE